MYIFTSGEMLSESIRRVYLQALANSHTARAGVEQLVQMSLDMQQGRFQEVLDRYDSLPPQMRTERTALLYRLLAAWNVGEEPYSAAVDAFHLHFPHDPSLHLNALEYFVSQNEFAKAYDSIDEIQAAVGDDAYLDVLRARVAWREGSLDAAKQHATAAIQSEPDLRQAYEELLRVSLATREYADAVKVLSTMKRHTQTTVDLQPDQFSEFLQSQEYKDWVSTRE
jgi:tetratricopeptide (TPR) repeat protein